MIGLIGLKTTEKSLDFGLSISAGIMLGTSLYELLPCSFEKSGYIIAIASFVTGVVLIALINKHVPHEHVFKGYEGSASLKTRLKSIYLIILAVLIHNIPEGMAVGATSYIDVHTGLVTTFSIALQDIPEGYAVSFPLSMITRRKLRSFTVALLSGLSETVMAVVTASLMKIIAIEGYVLGVASGAMMYVVSHEVIPETHRYGYETLATTGFIVGFLASLLLMELF